FVPEDVPENVPDCVANEPRPRVERTSEAVAPANMSAPVAPGVNVRSPPTVALWNPTSESVLVRVFNGKARFDDIMSGWR
ncbi:hypothetical protein JZU56_03685, partial [bacterium]|nr:hypothetical protein [bacterium]